MITEYITKALEKAHYEILADDGTYYGEIPDCPGVYANAESLEQCRRELGEVLEEWILFRVHQRLPIPRIDDVEIVVRKEDVA